MVAVLAMTGVAAAQTSSGTLSGRVTYEGEGMPGVTVTLTSPDLQGQRVTVTSTGGGYQLPGLPAGTYTVTFQLDGFRALEQEVKISVAQSRYVDAVLVPESVTGEIEVTGRLETVSTTLEGAETVEQDVLEKLAVDRSLVAAVSLTAGTTNTGPFNQAVISGAQSYENLYTMNGIVLNENLRNQPMDMYIEDSIQESTVLTSGVSAEFGRFSGGVVNMITKSGGNQFTGSFRVSFDNDDWTASTPFTTDKIDEVNTTLEATLGGYLWKDRLWFFLAGRNRELDFSEQTYITQIPYQQNAENKRLEGKLTAQLSQNHRFAGTYSVQESPTTNVPGLSSIPPMDMASIDPQADFDNEGVALHYTGVLSDTFFVEAQYSKRDFTIVDFGGDDPSLLGGTLIYDLLLGGSFGAPWQCGEPCRDQERDNENYLAKASWFISSENAGTHDLAFGYDSFDDQVVYDNHQTASDWYLITLTQHDFSTGEPLAVLFPFAFVISYSPVLEKSQRTHFKTNSAFVNDTWRISDRLTLNLGVRWDENDGTDAGGATVVDDSRVSPRLGATWDLFGNGEWILNAGFSRYVSSVAYTVVNQGTAAGRPLQVRYLYAGPPAFASELGGNEAALAVVFDWFFNVYGGVENPALLFGATIPGLTPQIGSGLGSPYVDEYTVGFTTRLGGEGVLRADYVHREYADFYAGEIVPNRWVSSEITGPLDLEVYGNENDLLERVYDGLMTRFQYRLGDRWLFGGNWTWSHARGNWDGERETVSALAGDVTAYREYKDPSWNSPRGDLAVDQRHKVRLWAIWDAVQSRRHNLSLSLLQSYLSGSPYSAIANIDNALGLEYVGNPGYITPPAFVDYYFSGRGEYTTDSITSTDLAVNYSFIIPTGNRSLEVYVQPEVLNVFNEQGAVRVNTSVLTAANDPTLQFFNPLTETPAEGVHWRKSESFGKPISEGHYQQPRTFRVSVGVRF
jgi:hypothetical protein